MKLKLDNGLEVILEENHTASVVAFQAWVKAGAADEPLALAGVSHFLEHMLFKGTAKRGVGAIAREVEGAGGEINAWTSYDETVFHLVLASSFFDTGLDILADALVNSSFDSAELERERGVILEEIKQGLDDPDRVAAHTLFEGAFDKHPYARPVIGSEASVRAMKREDIIAYHRTHYVGPNITLVVVGDFDALAVQRQVETTFAIVPAGKAQPARKPATGPSQLTVKALARDFKKTQVLLGFRIPPVVHEDIPALDLLAVTLGQGESSRLNREVVRNQQVASAAYSYVFSGKDGGMLVIGATLPPGKVDLPARAVLDQALRLAREDVPPVELAKARTILESDRVFDRETVQGFARKLGFFAAIAQDPHFESTYMARLAGLTAGDLRAVAARYLRVDNMTAVAQLPEAKADRQAAKAEKARGALLAVAQAAETQADARWMAKVTPRMPAGDTPVLREVLPSGVRVLIMRDPSVPIVALRALWLGGLRYEDARSNGISNFLASLMTKGTKTRSAEEIMTEVEGMAGSVGGFSGRNTFGMHGEFLSRQWERGLDLFTDCLLNASFAEDEIEKERRLVLDELRDQEDNLGHQVFQLFHSTMWKRHPYRLDPLGSADSVAAITRRRLLSFYRRYYGLSNLTLAIVGDVEPARVLARLRALLPPDAATPVEIPTPSVEAPAPEPVQAFRFLEREQAHVVLGFPGTTLDSPDRFALEIVAQALAGQGGRLFAEVREKRSLAYSVSAFSLEGIDPGYFAIYMASSPTKLDEGLGVLRGELQRMAQDGVTREEFERAKRYLIGSHAIGLQRKSAVAAALAFHEAYGQGWQEYRRYADRLGQVKLADVKRAAARYLDPRHELLAVVKPANETPAAARTNASMQAPAALR